MKFRLHHTQPENQEVQTFWFEPSASLRYQAGQFVELILPHPHTDERGDHRWFTLSSSPTEKFVSITTRNFGKKASSFKKTLFALKPGDEIKASETMGDFVLPKDSSRPLLFVAGGIGITPMRSMAKFLADTHEERDITLLYAARDDKNLLFLDLFRTIQAKVMPITPTHTWRRLSSDLILQYAHPDSLIFISGPEPMTEKLVDELNNKGVKEARLVTDYFPGYDNEYASTSA